jgi:hypothetical protein
MIKELDIVALKRALPEHGLVAGDTGTIVMLHEANSDHGPGVTVEFMTYGGKTIAIATLPADAVRPIESQEIPHVREVVANVATINGGRIVPLVSIRKA